MKVFGLTINVRTIVSTVLLIICVGAGYMHFTGKVGPSQVVLITIDGARADTFWQVFENDAGPLLEEAAAGGLKADFIKSVNPPVAPTAHASLLSGASPAMIDQAGGDVETLFTAVGASTDRPTVFIDSTGGELATLADEASVVYSDRDFRTEGQEVGDRLPTDLLIKELRADQPPALSFLVLPMADVTGREYGPDSSEYRAALGGAIGEVERVLEALDEAGLLSRTAVVITSTHGMADDPADPSVAANMQVPLIMSGPGFKQDYTLAEASIVDIAPTLSRLLGVKLPAQADGVVASDALLRLRNRIWALISGLSLIAFGITDYLLGRKAQS